jgi:hypothetical protein
MINTAPFVSCCASNSPGRLDTQAFARPLVTCAALSWPRQTLVQHGLSGDGQDLGGLVQRQPAVGDDPAAQGLGDADQPGSGGGEPLTGQEAALRS